MATDAPSTGHQEMKNLLRHVEVSFPAQHN